MSDVSQCTAVMGGSHGVHCFHCCASVVTSSICHVGLVHVFHIDTSVHLHSSTDLLVLPAVEKDKEGDTPNFGPEFIHKNPSTRSKHQALSGFL